MVDSVTIGMRPTTWVEEIELLFGMVVKWIVYLVIVISACLTLVVAPIRALTTTMNNYFSYFYTVGSGNATLFYIGTKATVAVNFAGFTLDYTNNFTVGQSNANTNPQGSPTQRGTTQTTGNNNTGHSTSDIIIDGQKITIPTNSFFMIPLDVVNPAQSSLDAMTKAPTTNSSISSVAISTYNQSTTTYKPYQITTLFASCPKSH